MHKQDALDPCRPQKGQEDMNVRKNREADTMAMLKGFRSTLFDAKQVEGKFKSASSSKIANSSGEIARLAETHTQARNDDARREAQYSRS